MEGESLLRQTVRTAIRHFYLDLPGAPLLLKIEAFGIQSLKNNNWRFTRRKTKTISKPNEASLKIQD